MRIYGTPVKHFWYPKGYYYHSLRTAGLEETFLTSLVKNLDPIAVITGIVVWR
jgi:hypothetical protein